MITRVRTEAEMAAGKRDERKVVELCKKAGREDLIPDFIVNSYSAEEATAALLNILSGRDMDEPLRTPTSYSDQVTAEIESLCNRAGLIDSELRSRLSCFPTVDEARVELDAQRRVFPGKFRAV